MGKTISRVFAMFLLGFLIIGLFPSLSMAQQLKIGYVDVIRLKQEYKEFRDAEVQFERYMAVLQAKADSMQANMQELADRLEKQDLMLTEQAKSDIREQLLVKQNEYQMFVNQVMGAEGEAAQREYELSKPVIEKINTAIKLIALKGDYSFILDSTAGTVLYGNDKFDITNQVLTELNK
jgi:outer membrane protein